MGEIDGDAKEQSPPYKGFQSESPARGGGDGQRGQDLMKGGGATIALGVPIHAATESHLRSESVDDQIPISPAPRAA